MSFKTLHSFTVHLDREVTEVTTTEENGQKVTREFKSTKAVPFTILLKDPSRSEKQALALFQHVRYNEAINLGLLPKVVMQQKLGREATSPLSEEEDKTLTAMNKRLRELATEFIDLTRKRDTPPPSDFAERKERLLSEYLITQKKVIDMNVAYQSVYAYTAENYTQSKTLTWLALFLSYVRDGEATVASTATPRALFTGVDFAAKEQVLGDFEEAADPLYVQAIQKLPTYWMLYLFGRASKTEDFVKYDEDEAKRLETEAKMKAEMEKVEEETKATAVLVGEPNGTVVPPVGTESVPHIPIVVAVEGSDFAPVMI